MTKRTRDRTELAFLVGGLVLVLLLLGLCVAVRSGARGRNPARRRSRASRARQADDPSLPIGPAWLRGAALDITALGSASVLGLVVAAIVGFMILQGLRRTALLVFVASAGGWLLNSLLKELFQRPRPEVVPHLSEVMSLSFPSGHAMTSAAVYLTLGALRDARSRPAGRRRMYCMGFAMFLAGIVGVTRVYLGVHYPTDVLAGWLVGLSWALLCWLVERAIERRRGVEQPVR